MNVRAALIGGALAIAAALVALVMSLVVSLPAGASTGSGGGSTATGTSARESAVRPNTCSATEGGVNQSISGRISGCLRVGAVASGRYTVVVDQDVQQRSGPLSGDELGAVEAKLRGLKAKLKGGGALVAVHEPAVTLALSPSSGPPGTTVRITGRLGSRVAHRSGYLNFCWDGCDDGLQYDGVQTTWTSATTFHARLVVPGAPWIEGDPVRVAPLSSGGYPIGVECVVQSRGCGLGASEGSAVFALRVSSAPAWCRSAASCAQLTVTPGAALPGGLVSVGGYAPLESVIGSDQPFVFQFELNRGAPRGSEVHFIRSPKAGGVTEVTFGHGALDVLRPPSFRDLNGVAPVSQTTGGVSQIAADPADTGTVAWCGTGTIGLSQAGVRSSFSTSGAAAVLKRMGFSLLGSSAPQCAAVAPAGNSSQAGSRVPTVAAAFSVGLARYGAPPVYYVALITSDDGASWTQLPVPPGASPESFGGFRYESTGALQAVFAASRIEHGKGGGFPLINAAEPLSETSADGGGTWQPGGLGCPAAGPCVTLGPFLAGNCAMGLSTQLLLRSADGGARWSQPPALPEQVQPCGDLELYWTAGGSELLVNSLSPYALTQSRDRGVTWNDVSLPSLPTGRGQPSLPGLDGVGPAPGGIVVLGDGSLLLTGELSHWELLRPGAGAWCRVRSVPVGLQRAEQASPVVEIAGQLWWLVYHGSGPAGGPAGSQSQTPAIEPETVAASSASC